MKLLLTPQVRSLALSIMEGLRCPRAVTVSIMIRYDMWEDLVKLDLRPTDYDSPEAYLRAAQATALLAKLDCTIPGMSPEKTCKEAWWEAERHCFKTNSYLYELMDRGPIDEHEEKFIEFLLSVRKWVKWFIGSQPPSLIEGRFGPGATISDKSGRTTVLHKLSSTPTLTSDATIHLDTWAVTKWGIACNNRGALPSFSRGNIFFMVNKNAKTKRGCAKEPSINAYYQRGRGVILSKRLSQRGLNISRVVDLDDSTATLMDRFGIDISGYSRYASATHVQVARAASAADDAATIDERMASDTVAKALVEWTFPTAWFRDLSSLRSPFTEIEGKMVRLEKFSSMGNGFTFELETILFASICLAVCPWLTPGKDLHVFGDDIIVPKESSKVVCLALRACGFLINEKKSFVSGPFRESCGGDFWTGVGVRPYYLKKEPNEPQDYIALANGISRVVNQDPCYVQLRADLRNAWFRTLDAIPFAIRQCRGPSSLGDLVIHDDEKYWQRRLRQQKSYIRVYRPINPPKVVLGRFDDDVLLAGALYGLRLTDHKWGIGWSYDQRTITMRGKVSGYKVGWINWG